MRDSYLESYKTLRLVLACGDLKIDWERPESRDTPAEYVLKESRNWLPSQNEGQEAAFQLYLGCEKELNTFEVRNSNNKYRSTRRFKVSALNSSNEGFGKVIVNGEMENSKNYDGDNIPILRFYFNNTLAQYVQFYILNYYGSEGGGLNYFNVYQDLNEYIYQKSDFPSLSHDETGFMCQDVVVDMKLDDHYVAHENVLSWSLCQGKCLEDEECQAWSWGPRSLNFKLSKYEKMSEARDANPVSGLRQCKQFQQNFT